MNGFAKVGVATGFLGFMLLAGCGGGHYYAGVAVGPPAPLIEGPYGVTPGPGYIWTPGFYDWDGGNWAWRRGEWRRPPHRGDHWVSPRWDRRGNGYQHHGGRWQRGNRGHR
ncbi:MAG TPA: hypothetical protein VK604_17510 [Bryobacteraceae bacterium]|nr:hypothetical protein [Bryobacteraceae bacterium]